MRFFFSVFRLADRAPFVACLITLISLCAAPSLAAENAVIERRLALVIGNNAYKESALANAVNDAEAMGAALSRVGFEVTVLKDAPLKVMQETIVDFGNRLKNGGIGLFYYAGHGVQVRGVNYLIPVDADIKSAGSIRFQTIGLDLVMDQMGDARNRANFVVLDACRDNPFERRLRGDGGARGLAAVNVDPASGFFIAFATAPGKTADDGDGNGVYTAALLESLKVPGLKAEELFKRTREAVLRRTARRQTPWEQSSLIGDVIFNLKAAPPQQTAATATAPLPSLDPRQIDLGFWGSIQSSNDPEDYLAYLKKFPEGEFTMLAQRRLASLRDAAEPVPSRGTLGQVQRPDRPAIGTVLWSSEKSGERIVALTAETYTTETFGRPATVREIRSRKTGVPISSEMDLGGGVVARSTFVVTAGNPELLVTSKAGTPIRYSLQIQMQMRFLDGDTKRSVQQCDFEASVLDEESIEMNGKMVRGLAVEEKSRCDGRDWKVARSYFVPNYGLFLAASAKVELPVSR